MICKICEKTFNGFPSQLGRTCSKKCGNKMISIKRYKKEFNVLCRYCKLVKHVLSCKQFNSNYFKLGYCSRKCQRKNETVPKICLICQKLFNIKKSRKDTAKYCSNQCYNKSKEGKIVNQLFGKDNPKWNPNKYSRTYPSSYLKAKVKERDGRKCYICGATENLNVHHLKNFKDVREHKIDNLLTLCKDCHWNVHRRKYQLSKLEGGNITWMTQ